MQEQCNVRVRLGRRRDERAENFSSSPSMSFNLRVRLSGAVSSTSTSLSLPGRQNGLYIALRRFQSDTATAPNSAFHHRADNDVLSLSSLPTRPFHIIAPLFYA